MQNDQEWDSLSLECLPNEILLNIFKYLTAADLSNAVLKVNKRLSDLSRDALRPRLRWIRGAIHQLLSIILKLRILVLLLVSTMPYVVIVKNYS
jgi:hypothetical protein